MDNATVIFITIFFGLLFFCAFLVTCIIIILRQESPKPKPSKKKRKPLPSKPPAPKTDPNDPCIRQSESLHFGFLNKLDSAETIPDKCLPCKVKVECLQGKKPK